MSNGLVMVFRFTWHGATRLFVWLTVGLSVAYGSPRGCSTGFMIPST